MMPEPIMDARKAEAATPPVERLVTTEHRLVIDGRTLEYQATCGTLLLRELRDAEVDDAARKGRGEYAGEKPRASVFFVAYTLKQPADAPPRPLTLSFNGGPGSSSVWLHLGLLGPQRVPTDEMGQ